MSKGYCEKSELTAIAEAIRGKTGKTDSMALSEMPNEILAIQTGVPTQEKNVSITSNGKSEILPDEGYGLSKVEVNVAVPMDMNAKLSFDNWSGGSNIANYISKVDLSPLYSRKVLSLNSMFSMFVIIETLDLRELDTTKVKTLNYTFNQCYNLKYLDLSTWDTSSVTSMESIFNSCNKLEELYLGENWASNTALISFSVGNSPITHDCCLDVFNKLATKTSTATLRLSPKTKALMSDDEIKIATDKGWTVS